MFNRRDAANAEFLLFVGAASAAIEFAAEAAPQSKQPQRLRGESIFFLRVCVNAETDIVGQHKRSVAGGTRTPGTENPYPGLPTGGLIKSATSEISCVYSLDALVLPCHCEQSEAIFQIALNFSGLDSVVQRKRKILEIATPLPRLAMTLRSDSNDSASFAPLR